MFATHYVSAMSIPAKESAKYKQKSKIVNEKSDAKNKTNTLALPKREKITQNRCGKKKTKKNTTTTKKR